MVAKHELDGVQLDQLAYTAVADGQVTEELECLADDRLTRSPVLQVRDSGKTYSTLHVYLYTVHLE